MSKRLLINRYPEIKESKNIPVSYNYAQLFTSIVTDDDGNILNSEFKEDYFKFISVTAYQTPHYLPDVGCRKPISKIFTIKHEK